MVLEVKKLLKEVQSGVICDSVTRDEDASNFRSVD